MDQGKLEEIKWLFLAVVFAAAITGLLSKEKEIVLKLKNLCAGVLGGGIVIIFSIMSQMRPVFTLVSCVLVSGFISSFWPVFGEIGMTMIHKYWKKQKKDDSV